MRKAAKTLAEGFIHRIPQLRAVLDGADVVRVRSVEGRVELARFLEAMFAYRPGLVRLLYRLRGLVVPLIGVRQPSLPAMDEWLPPDVPMLACGNIWFFSVSLADPERYWIGCCPHERHLTGYMGVVAEPLGRGRRRFHLVTVVHYKHWTGRLYFGLISPLNRFFMHRLARAGIAAGR
jgi:hypothetical protein